MPKTASTTKSSQVLSMCQNSTQKIIGDAKLYYKIVTKYILALENMVVWRRFETKLEGASSKIFLGFSPPDPSILHFPCHFAANLLASYNVTFNLMYLTAVKSIEGY